MVATALKAGSLAVIHVNSDDPGGVKADTISFVLLKPIGSGTTIYFTDRTWTPTVGSSTVNAGAFSSSGTDGTYAYTAGADLPAGTIINISTAQLNAAGININDLGEALYVYQGTDANTPTSFLYAAEIGDGNTTFNASLANTGLTPGTHTVALAGDNLSYGDRGHNIQIPDLLSRIGNSVNWSNNDNSPHVPVTGNFFSAPDQILYAAHPGPGGITRFYRDGTNVATQQHTAFENPATPTTHFFHPNDMVFDTVHGLFFVADSDQGNRRILQGNIADLMNPGVNPTLKIIYQDNDPTTAGGQFNGIAIDVDHATGVGALYFVNKGNFNRVTYDHDGTTTENQTPTLLAQLPSGAFANEIALDIASNRAWILSTATHTAAVEVPADHPGAQYDPDSDTYYITTTTPNNNEIWQVSGLDRTDTGTAGTTLARLDLNSAVTAAPPATHDNIGNHDLPTANGILTSIDFHAPTNTLYFTTQQHSGGTIGTGGVYTYNAANGVVTNVFAETSATDYAFEYIDVDPATGRIYISNAAFSSPGNPNGTTVNDSSIFVGQVGSGTFTKFASAGNINGSAPQGLIVNNAPTLTGNSLVAAVTEASSAPNSGETARPLLFSAITASDIDTPDTGDELAGAQVRISAGFTYEASSTAAGHTGTIDYLRIGGNTSGTLASGIGYDYDPTTGVMTLTGAATVAEYAAALNLVTFSTSGDNVTDDGNSITRTVSASVFDGLLYSDEIHTTVSVTGINDAPVNTVGGAMNFTEDTTGTAGNQAPPPSPVNAITGISFADADADATSQIFTATLSVANGTLTIRTNVTGGLLPADVAGNGTNQLVLTGTQTEINTTLAATNLAAAPNGLVYTPNANFNGADTLTIVTNDQGNNGNDPDTNGDNGTSEADTDLKTLNVADVNDAPTVSGNGAAVSPTILEDTPFTIDLAPSIASRFIDQFSDALDIQFDGVTNPTGSTGDGFAGIAVVANGSSAGTGQWQWYNGSAWQDIGAVSIDAAKTFAAVTPIRFNPALNFNGAAPTLSARLIESSATAVTNNATVDLNPAPPTTGNAAIYSAGTVTLSQQITPVNDAPVNTVGAALNINEDAPAANLTGISIADVDANPATDQVSVTLDVDHGTLGLLTNVAGGIKQSNIVSQDGDTITLLATINEINTTLGAAGGLTYLVDANYNGADTLEITTNDRGFSGLEPGLTGDGATEEDIDSKAINIASVNDAPSGADKLNLLINEDATYVFQYVPGGINDFGFSDPIDNNAFGGVEIVVLPALGALKLNGVTIANSNTFVSAQDIAGGKLTYTPALNSSGTDYTFFTFKVVDDGASGGLNVNKDPGADTFSFDVKALNDAPTHSAPVSVTLNEDTSIIFTGANAITVADVDAGNADVTTTLSIAGGNLSVGTVMSGLVVTGEGTGNMILYGTIAEINDALDGLTFTPEANVHGPTTLNISTNDEGASGADPGLSGDGTDEVGTAQIAVNVNQVNDAPSGADKTLETSEDDALVITAADFGFSDTIDLNSFLGVKITMLPPVGSGQLTLNGVAIAQNAFITLQQLNAGAFKFVPDPDESGSPYATFTFQVQDDGGTANGGVDLSSPKTITINVTPDNTKPVVDLDADNSNSVGDVFTSAYTEGGTAAPIADTDTLIADQENDQITGATITILGTQPGDTLTISGNLPNGISASGSMVNGSYVLVLSNTASAADYAAALELVRFSSSSQDPTDGGAAPTRTITTVVTDAFGTSLPATTTMTVTGINDAPSGLPNAISAQEDTPRTLSVIDFTFEDAEDDALFSVSLSNVSGGKIFYEGVEATLPKVFTAADLNAGKVQFRPNAELSGMGAGSFTFQVRDDGGDAGDNEDTDATPTTMTVDINAVNDPSVVTASGGATSFVEGINVGSTPVAVDAGITVTDVDDTALSSATVSITANFNPSTDTLAFTNDGVNHGDIQANGFVAGVLSLSSASGNATLAQWQAALRAVTYTNSSENPANSTRTVSFQVNDGTDPSNIGTKQLTVTAANDTPVGLNGSTNISEDVSFALVSGFFPFNDVENNALLSVTIDSVTGGVIMFDADGAGVNPAVQATLPMTFSAADLDAGKIVFKPTAHLNGAGAGSVTFRVTDNGGNSPGQATDQSANTLAINIASVNDAPSGGTPVKEFVENTTYVFDDLDFGFTDVEPNAFLAVKITTLPDAGKGTMFLNNVPVVAGAFVSVADIEAGKLTYVPVANMTGTPYASFTFQVQDNGTTANGGVDLDPTPNLFTFNVTPDEKPPVAVDDSANAVEDGSIGPGPAFNVLTNDTDANSDPLTVVGVSYNGNAGTVGVAIKGKYGTLTLNSDGSYTYAADQDLLDTIATGTPGLQDVFTYEVSDNVTGSDFGTLTINVSTANDDLTTNGNGGHNTIYGDNPVPGTEDSIFGFSGNDTLYGLDGADKLYGASGDDGLFGGNGWDSLFGDTGNDFMDGGAGNDLLDGGGGIDRMFGRAGIDNLLAGGGNDIVDGGADADTLSGGSGYDVFIFLSKEHIGTQVGAHDVIGDFQVNVDKIDLSAIYGSFGSVTLTNGMTPGAFGLATFKDGGKTWVVGDVDGNGTADFGLELTGSHTLKLSDFILNQAQWNAFFTKIAQPGTDYVALHTEPMM